MQLEALWCARIHSPCYRISFVVSGGGRDEGRGIPTEAILLLKQTL
jgi:hypothetical protein